MSASSTVVGDRRRQALERMSAQRQRPDRRSRRKPMGPPSTSFYVIAFVVTGLTLLGLVMVFSASAITSFHRGNSPWRLFNRQLLWAVFGGIAMIVAAKVPYYKWRRFAGALLTATLALMFLPFVPGLGRSVNESRAWVFVGPIGFQPSEFLKVGVLVFGAHVLSRGRIDMSKFWTTVKPLALAGGCGVVLCALQGDLGSAIVLAAIVFAVVFIAGSPVVPMALCAVGASSVIGLMVFSSTRRFNRFTAFLDITAHKDHLSYQVYQAMIGMATGGVSGTGVGSGPSKWGYLPLAHSDFIFAVIGEEIGLVGVVAVIGGFLLLTYFGIQTAINAQDRFGTLLAGGVVAWLAIQAVINVGGVSGAMPVTGLTLPFVSSGGSSLLSCMVGAGLLLNVSRHAR